jgi:hypothetical protein
MVYSYSESDAQTSDRQASRRERADITYKILLDSYNKYLDDVFKTAGLLFSLLDGSSLRTRAGSFCKNTTLSVRQRF